MEPPTAAARVEIVEPLRGLAALSVAWFHFTQGGGLLQEGWLKSSGAYAWLGVQVFFVLSGFVVPYAMHRGGYAARRDWGVFMMKRIVRLDPPYLAAIALAIGLWYLSAALPGHRGPQPSIEWVPLLLHLGYLNTFFGNSWILPVFWSLAIEFQFYLFCAAAFPLIAHPRTAVRMAALAVMCASAFAVPSGALVFHYMGLFAMGLLAFHLRTGMLAARAYFAALAAVAAAAGLSMGWAVALLGVVTTLIVSFVEARRFAPLAFLGTVSYSLYLFHVPIGGRVVNLGARYADSLALQLLVLAAALAASLVAAYLLYRAIERPAQQWAARLRYSARRPTA